MRIVDYLWTGIGIGKYLNYKIHTDAIKNNLILPDLTSTQIAYTYSNEADILNVVLFGMERWKSNSKREYAGWGSTESVISACKFRKL